MVAGLAAMVWAGAVPIVTSLSTVAAQVANGLWMSQIARNVTDAEQGILTGKRYLIHDRDTCSPLSS